MNLYLSPISPFFLVSLFLPLFSLPPGLINNQMFKEVSISMTIYNPMRRICLLHSFAIIFLYWFYDNDGWEKEEADGVEPRVCTTIMDEEAKLTLNLPKPKWWQS